MALCPPAAAKVISLTRPRRGEGNVLTRIWRFYPSWRAKASTADLISRSPRLPANAAMATVVCPDFLCPSWTGPPICYCRCTSDPDEAYSTVTCYVGNAGPVLIHAGQYPAACPCKDTDTQPVCFCPDHGPPRLARLPREATLLQSGHRSLLRGDPGRLQAQPDYGWTQQDDHGRRAVAGPNAPRLVV